MKKKLFDLLKPLAKKHSLVEFYKILRQKQVPSDIAEYFYKKYSKSGKLSQETALKNLYQELLNN